MTSNKKIFNVGIIGCGLIGKKRSESLGDQGKLIACADIDLSKAKKLANLSNAKAYSDWTGLVKDKDIEIVIVSTLHDSLTPITCEAIKEGKHVLVEKPVSRNVKELSPLVEMIRNSDIKVRVGFNHRFHPAIAKAKGMVDQGILGELMYIRGRYGHGGRLGYEKEWRANPEISGGGELIDQGPHLIDLSRWFLGSFSSISGNARRFYWDMEVDDNCFMTLQTKEKKIAFLHVSCTEWKNIFSLEIYGRKGKLEITGLGGSYGKEKLIHYKMLPEMGVPEIKSWSFQDNDISWEMEMKEFYKDIETNRSPEPGIKEAHEALQVIETIYKESGYDFNKKSS